MSTPRNPTFRAINYIFIPVKASRGAHIGSPRARVWLRDTNSHTCLTCHNFWDNFLTLGGRAVKLEDPYRANVCFKDLKSRWAAHFSQFFNDNQGIHQWGIRTPVLLRKTDTQKT